MLITRPARSKQSPLMKSSLDFEHVIRNDNVKRHAVDSLVRTL
jgi:hypothetical protein